MRAVLAVIVAVTVWLVGTVLSSLLVQHLVSIEQLESTMGQIGWFALPQAVVSFVMVLLAGLAYGRSQTWSLLSATIVLAPPAVELVSIAVLSIVGETPAAVLITRFLLGAVGILAAWWLVVPKEQTPTLSRR
ncbi:hypothetical protein [Allosalinactinospora lopnorensis]|uniref:hypothetical protein n=1 Tax=Allosalinactinospora lopnorensis TaxID=1352348 RepID=UPI000623EEFF|nr:hypothetical protein [Allosalinactinospora lopnorensis]